jgi:hypothetical protein
MAFFDVPNLRSPNSKFAKSFFVEVDVSLSIPSPSSGKPSSTVESDSGSHQATFVSISEHP